MVSTLLLLGALAQGPSLSKDADVADLIRRMMAFDKDADGKLTRDEVTDARLRGLVVRADVDSDGFVTKAELTAIGEAEHSDTPDFDSGPGGPPPGFGGPPGGRFPRLPRPGEILSPPMRRLLDLKPDQQAKVDELQATVDAALGEILTEAQRKTLKDLRERPPGPPR